MEMAFASFLSYALLLLQFSLGSNGQKFFIDTSSASAQEFSIDKSDTNPQGFSIKTKENLEGSLMDDKSKTNAQEFLIKTKLNPNFVEESEINPQGIFFIGFHSKPPHEGLNPAFNHVFFKASDLFPGKKLQIYFFTYENFTPSNTHQLSRDEADSIPFSSSRLPDLLESFSIPNHSPQVEAMEATLKQCEAKPNKDDEFNFCATSFESMLDKTRGFLGTTKPRVLTTKIMSSDHALLQNYTIVKKPLGIRSNKLVVCHTMAYPYRVYYCHSHQGRSNKLFKMALVGDNRERVEAVAVCHMDTSTWDPNHVSFKLIGGQPGTTSVCHILPVDNIAWIPSP